MEVDLSCNDCSWHTVHKWLEFISIFEWGMVNTIGVQFYFEFVEPQNILERKHWSEGIRWESNSCVIIWEHLYLVPIVYKLGDLLLLRYIVSKQGRALERIIR